MTFAVEWSETAEEDLDRLHEYRLERARIAEDFDLASRALEAIRVTAQGVLARTPYSCRKAGRDPLWREVVMPFGSTGYIALFEILLAKEVVMVHAVRHQLEEDYR
ncbi:type II toxin-antitoxin system RelE/ParE family toxin [Ramlibacter sp. 2FC]|uniref:type II toxin-antitoxin system RelE/ParE family toxin n=1 Tax=Ramlibacter sp. 2FC TaxID=2502188 RepID=UPI0010F90A32|nr:type II toxin-antitoxin system RelE/ParE family toxin [Ramlibacter sp. 2FC]